MGKWRFQMYDLVIGRKWFAWLPIFDLTTDEVPRAIRRIKSVGLGFGVWIERPRCCLRMARWEIAGSAGIGRRRRGYPRLLAKLHPKPAEGVFALVAVGNPLRAPPGIAGRDLDDGTRAGLREYCVDLGGVHLAVLAEHPAHDVVALRVPAGVDAKTGRAADGRRVLRARRLDDPLLDIGGTPRTCWLCTSVWRREGARPTKVYPWFVIKMQREE